MLIGLTGDTHIPEVEKEIPPQIKEIFRGVDLILHTGDVYLTPTLDELECIAPVLAAQGDDDEKEIYWDKRMEEKFSLNFDGVNILLKHGAPQYLDPDYKLDFTPVTFQVSSEFKMTPDILVYGHTHEARVEIKGNMLLVNPGSPTFPKKPLQHKVYERKPGTVALLNINSGKVEVRFVQLQ